VYTNNTDACDDGDACTVTDVCLDGACTGSGAPDCDDGNLCTDDSCDSGLGCVNAFNTLPCDDGNECNVTDACLNGVCVGTGVVNCDDSNICTDDTCDADTGCVFTDNTNPCDDGDACTAGDTCAGGACQSGTDVLDCDDGVDCTADSCDPDVGCVNAPVDLDCDDGVGCTADVCDPDLGCVNTPVHLDCDDGVDCTTDVCDPVLDCINTPTLPNGFLFEEDFSAPAPGWTMDGEWEFGPAVAGPTCGNGGQDPAADHTDTTDEALAGVDIGGCYDEVLHPYHCLTSPVIDTAGYDALELTYWRWLHSDYTPYVHNKVEVFDGAVWHIIWQTGGLPFFHDSDWTEMNHDLSGYANPTLRVRWCFNVDSGGVIDEAGWSLDDIALWGSGDFFCDDDNDCTDDVCDPVLGCINTSVDAYCDDGVGCTTDVCDPVLGCVNTPVHLDCDDGVDCTIDVCDPTQGCLYSPVEVTLFEEDFFAPAPGWTMAGEWEIGPADAGVTCYGGTQDPGSDHTDTTDEALAGVDIGGCYDTAPHGYHCLTTPVLDASGYDTLELNYWRWLQSDYTPYVHNKVEVFDGAVWQIIWQTGGFPGWNDTSWTEMTHDISGYANPTLRVRWCFNVDIASAYDKSGWSLDDISIYGDGPCCGDGDVEGPEQCDDGNQADGDGCSSICEHESFSGTAREVDGTWIDVTYVTCGSGAPGSCTAAVAQDSCAAIGERVISHASDGTPLTKSLGATVSCNWSTSYFTVATPVPPDFCLVGISNLEWASGSCCPATHWHGNTIAFDAPGVIFGYVDTSNSGYVAGYPNISGHTWGCSPLATAAANLGGCNTQYVACTAGVTYSEQFTQGQASGPQCTEWQAFQAKLTDVYSSVTIRGSIDPVGVTCTGADANSICQALHNDQTGTWNCDGRTWMTGNCGGGLELSAAGSICGCPGNEYIVRPCIGNDNWGGAGTDTCDGPTQTLEVVCK